MPRSSTARTRAERLTPAQVRRAIVLDFEGVGPGPTEPNPAPSLLGTLKESTLIWVVLDPNLTPLTRAVRGLARHAVAGEWESTFRRLAAEAEQEERALLYFSRHEHDVLLGGGFLDASVSRLLAPHLADGKALLKRACIERQGQDRPRGERTLAGYGAIWRPALVARQEDVAVGDTIRQLRQACQGRKRLRTVSSGARGRFENLLEYNRLDLKILRESCSSAASLLTSRPRRTATGRSTTERA